MENGDSVFDDVLKQGLASDAKVSETCSIVRNA